MAATPPAPRGGIDSLLSSGKGLLGSIGASFEKKDLFTSKEQRELAAAREELLAKDALVQELQARLSQLDALKDEMARQESEVDALKRRAKEAEAERDETVGRLLSASAELDRARTRTAELEAALRERNQQLTSLQKAIEQESRQAEVRAEEKKRMKGMNENAVERAQRLEKELEEAKRDARDALEAARRKDETMRHVNEDRDQLYHDIARLTDENAALLAEVARLSEALGTSKLEEERLRNSSAVSRGRRREATELSVCALPEGAIKADQEFHRLFPELPDDVLVEAFPCIHQKAAGTVYVARRHVCWLGANETSRFVLPLTRITAVDKVRSGGLLPVEGTAFDIVCESPEERVHLNSPSWEPVSRTIMRQARAADHPVRELMHGKDETTYVETVQSDCGSFALINLDAVRALSEPPYSLGFVVDQPDSVAAALGAIGPSMAAPGFPRNELSRLLEGALVRAKHVPDFPTSFLRSHGVLACTALLVPLAAAGHASEDDACRTLCLVELVCGVWVDTHVPECLPELVIACMQQIPGFDQLQRCSCTVLWRCALVSRRMLLAIARCGPGEAVLARLLASRHHETARAASTVLVCLCLAGAEVTGSTRLKTAQDIAGLLQLPPEGRNSRQHSVKRTQLLADVLMGLSGVREHIPMLLDSGALGALARAVGFVDYPRVMQALAL
eukprot:m51a1_g4614 hypothetical protein (681) ;mRNA; r:270288-272859